MKFTLRAARHENSTLAIISEVMTSAVSSDVVRQWICTRRDEQSSCTTDTNYYGARVISPERTLPDAWLLEANVGSGRAGSTMLVWLDARSWRAELPVGGIDGYGEQCDNAPGYCVWVEGLWTPFELLSPSCVRIGQSIAWSAVHIRLQERWADEKHYAPDPSKGPVPGTYSPMPEGWRPSACDADQVADQE